MSAYETANGENHDGEMPAASKRKSLRVPILVTKIKAEHNGNVFFGYAKNISKAGLFIQSINPKGEGEHFKIEFSLPGEDKPITCMAEVVWKRGYMPNARYEPGMGLKFMDLSSELSEKLDHWCHLQ